MNYSRVTCNGKYNRRIGDRSVYRINHPIVIDSMHSSATPN